MRFRMISYVFVTSIRSIDGARHPFSHTTNHFSLYRHASNLGGNRAHFDVRKLDRCPWRLGTDIGRVP